MSNDAEAEAVTRFLDKVSGNRVIYVVVDGRIITKDHEGDDCRRLTQCTDCVLVSHAFKTVAANLHSTHVWQSAYVWVRSYRATNSAPMADGLSVWLVRRSGIPCRTA